MKTIFSTQLEAVIKAQAAKTGLERVSLRYDSPLMQKRSNPHVEQVWQAAETLGIALSDVELVADVAEREGAYRFYGPSVGLKEGVLTLEWGKHTQPVEPDTYEVDFDDQGSLVLVFNGGAELSAVSVRVRTIRTDKPVAPTKILALFAQGKLDTVVAELGAGGERLQSLSGLAPNAEYSVTDYGIREFGDQSTYFVDVAGQGLFRANTYLSGILETEPTITPDTPAMLQVYPSNRTYKGHPVANVLLILGGDDLMDLAAFDSLGAEDAEDAAELVALNAF